MKPFKTTLIATALVAAGFVGNANAGTDSKTFQVKITITESCKFATAAATDVNFGTVARSENPAAAAGHLTVDCTVGTPYKIGLNEGQNSSAATATADNRRMELGGEYVPYGLYQDSTRSKLWGSETDGLHLTGTGVGNGQDVPVYGMVPTSSTNVPAGTYTDTVTATLTF